MPVVSGAGSIASASALSGAGRALVARAGSISGAAALSGAPAATKAAAGAVTTGAALVGRAVSVASARGAVAAAASLAATSKSAPSTGRITGRAAASGHTAAVARAAGTVTTGASLSAISSSGNTTLDRFDYLRTVISQYANSDNIRSIIDYMAQWFGQYDNIDNFYNYIWNVATAKGYGLDVWGRIVGVQRVLTVPDRAQYFGFSEAKAYGWGQKPWYDGGRISGNFSLIDDEFRTLIFCKALSNITGQSAAQINQTLLKLFPGRGNCYSSSNGVMQMMLTFEFLLLPYEIAILQQSGAFPGPAGVQQFILQWVPYRTFGFSEAGNRVTGWGQGAFSTGAAYA